MELEKLALRLWQHEITISTHQGRTLIAWLDTDDADEAIMVANDTEKGWNARWGDPQGKRYALSFHAALDGKPPLFTDEWAEVEAVALAESLACLRWAQRVRLPVGGGNRQYSVYGAQPAGTQ